MEKITFNQLSTPLKIATIGAWITTSIILIYMIIIMYATATIL